MNCGNDNGNDVDVDPDGNVEGTYKDYEDARVNLKH